MGGELILLLEQVCEELVTTMMNRDLLIGSKPANAVNFVLIIGNTVLRCILLNLQYIKDSYTGMTRQTGSVAS